MAWFTCFVALVLLGATAFAAPRAPITLQQLSIPQQPSLPRMAVEGVPVPAGGPSRLERIARKGLYGAVTGAIVGGGWSLLRTGKLDPRTLELSAGVGLAGGAAVGIIQAMREQPVDPRVLARPVLAPSAAAVGQNTGLPGARIFLRKSMRF